MGHSQFGTLSEQAPDGLLALIRLFQEDTRQQKIDLGVGVFRDDLGRTPVLRAVRAAERLLLDRQESKSYIGPAGDLGFVDAIARLALGDALSQSDCLVGVQTPGGNGALRLVLELLASASRDTVVWVGDPTWANHVPMIAAAGLECRSHRFYDPANLRVDFDGMMADLAAAKPGDAILLHACCHNPSGAGFTASQWAAILALCERQAVIPLLDFAYHGLGDGLDEDAAAVRDMVRALPEAIVAYSCDKNFGMYRDRVGALWVKAASPGQANIVRSHLFATGRVMWSMPPDHGAATCRIVLETPDLRAEWLAEVDAMRNRLNRLRASLAASHPKLANIAVQRGLFSLLPIGPEAVAELRRDHGIYLVPDGRINIAGLTAENLPYFTAQDCLEHPGFDCTRQP